MTGQSTPGLRLPSKLIRSFRHEHTPSAQVQKTGLGGRNGRYELTERASTGNDRR